jgi:hypothetical protein
MTTRPVPRPQPNPARAPKTVIQIVTRVPADGHEAIKALADAEGLTIQQLGMYAWNLALQSYGRATIPEPVG